MKYQNYHYQTLDGIMLPREMARRENPLHRLLDCINWFEVGYALFWIILGMTAMTVIFAKVAGI